MDAIRDIESVDSTTHFHIRHRRMWPDAYSFNSGNNSTQVTQAEEAASPQDAEQSPVSDITKAVMAYSLIGPSQQIHEAWQSIVGKDGEHAAAAGAVGHVDGVADKPQGVTPVQPVGESASSGASLSTASGYEPPSGGGTSFGGTATPPVVAASDDDAPPVGDVTTPPRSLSGGDAPGLSSGGTQPVLTVDLSDTALAKQAVSGEIGRQEMAGQEARGNAEHAHQGQLATADGISQYRADLTGTDHQQTRLAQSTGHAERQVFGNRNSVRQLADAIRAMAQQGDAAVAQTQADQGALTQGQAAESQATQAVSDASEATTSAQQQLQSAQSSLQQAQSTPPPAPPPSSPPSNGNGEGNGKGKGKGQGNGKGQGEDNGAAGAAQAAAQQAASQADAQRQQALSQANAAVQSAQANVNAAQQKRQAAQQQQQAAQSAVQQEKQRVADDAQGVNRLRENMQQATSSRQNVQGAFQRSLASLQRNVDSGRDLAGQRVLHSSSMQLGVDRIRTLSSAQQANEANAHTARGNAEFLKELLAQLDGPDRRGGVAREAASPTAAGPSDRPSDATGAGDSGRSAGRALGASDGHSVQEQGDILHVHLNSLGTNIGDRWGDHGGRVGTTDTGVQDSDTLQAAQIAAASAAQDGGASSAGNDLGSLGSATSGASGGGGGGHGEDSQGGPPGLQDKGGPPGQVKKGNAQ